MMLSLGPGNVSSCSTTATQVFAAGNNAGLLNMEFKLTVHDLRLLSTESTTSRHVTDEATLPISFKLCVVMIIGMCPANVADRGV